MDASPAAAACQREIEDLHAFFVAWFRGDVPDTDEVWARAPQVMAPGFVLVSPGGDRHERADLLTAIRAQHGGHAAGFDIWTKGFEVIAIGRDQITVRYEEWQRRGEDVLGRASLAVFAYDESAPHGVVWLAVQETWLPGKGPSAS
jgi:hypothetical protein